MRVCTEHTILLKPEEEEEEEEIHPPTVLVKDKRINRLESLLASCLTAAATAIAATSNFLVHI